MKGRERTDDFCFTPDHHQISSSSSTSFIFSAKNVPFYEFEKKINEIREKLNQF